MIIYQYSSLERRDKFGKKFKTGRNRKPISGIAILENNN